MMNDFIFQFLKVFIAMFIITDSIGNLPFFIGLTNDQSTGERRKIFGTAIFTGLILLFVFVFFGSLIFDLFNLTINDLKIAGGILLFLIAVEIMIRGRIVVEHKEDLGVVPLGCPLLVGPGAITSALVMVRIFNFWAVVSGIIACFILIWLILHYAENIFAFMGRNGALIITKIAAIIIAMIAVQFVQQGIQSFFQLN